MSEFENLVDDHYQALYRYALSLAHDSHTASDLVQETFWIWAVKGSQMRDRSKAKTWLFTTLYREFLKEQRRAIKYSYDSPAELSPVLYHHVDHRIDGQFALNLLGKMHQDYRLPLTLFYLKNHSYREIAAILEMPIGTIMSRLSRGKELIKRQLSFNTSRVFRSVL